MPDRQAREHAPADDASGASPLRHAPGSRERVDALLREHGAVLHRYCMAMLDADGVAALLPTIVGHLQEPATKTPPEQTRQVVLAVAHNRCIERSRLGGTPPSGQGLAQAQAQAQAQAVQAVAQLRPVGRDALVLRSLLGLRWHELERVCGIGTDQLVMRTCRAWRNVATAIEGGEPGPGPRPKGQRLGEAAHAWAAIREDARRFVALRQVLREVIERYEPAPGWQEEAWRRLEEQRAEQQRLAAKRAAERAAEAAARAAAVEAAAEVATVRSGAFASSVDEDEHEEDDEPTRRRSWRWLAVGVVLAVVGLAARWLVLR